MADLFTIATTAALTQFVGPLFKHLGEQALERAKQAASSAAAQLKAVGREPQPVEPKLFVPWVQGAGLESDPTLAGLWAALLANAADPAQKSQVQPGFAEVLRQLTPMDALVLAATVNVKPGLQGYAFFHTQELSRAAAVITIAPFMTALDNLSRLGLILTGSRARAVGEAASFEPIGYDVTLGPGYEYCRLTVFGSAFLAAVTPPNP